MKPNLEDMVIKELNLWGKLSFGFLVFLVRPRLAINGSQLTTGRIQGILGRCLVQRCWFLWRFS